MPVISTPRQKYPILQGATPSHASSRLLWDIVLEQLPLATNTARQLSCIVQRVVLRPGVFQESYKNNLSLSDDVP